MRRYSKTNLAFTSVLALSLAACGGSGDGSTTTTTLSDTAPVVSAGMDQTVFETETVQLFATASDVDGDPLTWMAIL